MKLDESVNKELTDLENGVFEEGGLHGSALSLIKIIYDLPGEYYSDQECMRLIHYAANAWSKLDDQGLS